MFEWKLPDELTSKALWLDPPAVYAAVVDIIGYAEEKTATSARITISKKLGGVSSLVIATDAVVHRPKKLVKTSAGDSNSRARFTRGWQTVGDRVILFTKATTETDTKYTVSFCVSSSVELEEDSQYGSIVFNSDFNVEMGDQHLPFLLEAFHLKRKKIVKVLQRMEGKEEMVVVIPIKVQGGLPVLRIAQNGDDIWSKGPHGTIWGLKAHLAMSFLTPKLFIDVEEGSVTNQLWVRSLVQTETKRFTINGEVGKEEEVSTLMTCGYTNKWPIQSLLLLYHRGRLAGLIQPKKKSRSMYKFLGIVHQIDREDASQMGLLEQCVRHYLSELEELRSRAVRISKTDEEWGQCTLCRKWLPVNQPLVSGEEGTCSKFDMLISCDDAESVLLPDVGSNKVPPTPASSRKRTKPAASENATALSGDRPQSPPLAAKKRSIGSSGDGPAAKVKATPKSAKKSASKGSKVPPTAVTESADSEPTMELEEKPQSPLKTAKKSKTKASQSPTKASQSPTKASQSPTKASQSPTKASQSPTKASQSPTKASQSPTKASQSPTKASQSPTKASQSPTKVSQSPTKASQSPTKSPAKAASQSRSRDNSPRDMAVFDFSDSEPAENETVPDSLSEGEMSECTTPALVSTNTQQMSGVEKMDENPAKRLEDYYSLSDDEDPSVLKLRELKCELIRSNKQLDLMRRTVIDYLNLLLGNSSADEAILKSNATAEEVVGILRKLLEDKDEMERQFLERQTKTKSKKDDNCSCLVSMD